MDLNNNKRAQLRLFSLDSNRPLAEKIATQLNIPLGELTITHFADGEVNVSIEESVRGDDVYIVQSTSNPVNDHLMTLMIAVDALRRASAKTINLVIPYYGYSRQDRQAAPREPLSAKLVANMFEMAGADHLLILDLHTSQIQGFFDVPVDHLTAVPLFADYFTQIGYFGDDVVVVSPDHSSAERARILAEYLNCSIAIINEKRITKDISQTVELVGEVENKTVILFDDMIDTAKTMETAVEQLTNFPTKEIFVAVTHALLSESAYERIQRMPINRLIVTDSIAMKRKYEQFLGSKLYRLSVDKVFSESITRVHEHRSMNFLLDNHPLQ